MNKTISSKRNTQQYISKALAIAVNTQECSVYYCPVLLKLLNCCDKIKLLYNEKLSAVLYTINTIGYLIKLKYSNFLSISWKLVHFSLFFFFLLYCCQTTFGLSFDEKTFLKISFGNDNMMFCHIFRSSSGKKGLKLANF